MLQLLNGCLLIVKLGSYGLVSLVIIITCLLLLIKVPERRCCFASSMEKLPNEHYYIYQEHHVRVK